MENKKLKEILKLHKMWLNREDGGQRANLSNANLSFADLSNADLRYVNLSDANLSGANLSNADLSYAYLSDANLSYANLSNADISHADLRCANLNCANLRNADLSDASIPMFCTWYTAIINDKIKIGCEIKSIEEWEAFLNSEEVIETALTTQELKQIEAMIRAYIAYLTTLNK